MQNVRVSSGKVEVLIGTLETDSANKVIGYNGVTSNTVGDFTYKDSPYTSFQATVEGSGALTATVNIHGSNDGVNYCSTALGTITLSGNDSVTNGFSYTALS